MAQEIKGKILITQEQILKRAEELGKQITEDYKGEELVLVGTLRGAVPWTVSYTHLTLPTTPYV